MQETKTTNNQPEAPEQAVLVGLDTGAYDCEASLAELEQLANTAGAAVVATMLQKRERPDTATCIGSGKLEELRDFFENSDADLLIFDVELSPTQLRNLEKELSVRVIDRTMLILDIFASRAHSGEGKLQVELAQLQYMLPRLGGQGTALSRLGGGIGTRGPGETKLESDRRHIRRRIDKLKRDLADLQQRRDRQRKRRKKDGIETVAIVGYTNAGKSTLMNRLTQVGVLAEDKLFATLDPTARALTLPDGRRVMLIDTVGLIRRLPHHLVEAFQSTLEEAASADLILNVCDASSEHCREHLEVTEKILQDMGCADIPVLCVLNKCDLLADLQDLPVMPNTVMISATENRNVDGLLDAIAKALPPTRKRVQVLIPYRDGKTPAALRRDGVVHQEEFRDDGLFLDVTADVQLLATLQDYIQPQA